MNRIRALFSGTRRFSLPAMLLLLAVLVSGVIERAMLQSQAEEPAALLGQRRTELSAAAQTAFAAKQRTLLEFEKKLSAKLGQTAPENIRGTFHDVTLPFSGAFMAVRNGEVLTWLGDFILSPSELNSLPYARNETFFYTAPLKTYLLFVRTLNGMLVLTGIRLEDRAAPPGSGGAGFAAALENGLGTEVTIDYHPYSAPPKDGRYAGIDLRNNAGKKIGLISLKNPSARIEAERLTSVFSAMQGALLVFAYLLFGFALSRDFNAIQRAWFKPFLLLLWIAGLRWLMITLNIPAAFLPGELSDPVKFSSKFGGGIVKSPIEFFVTVSFFFGWVLYTLRFVKQNNFVPPARLRSGGIIGAAALLLYAALLLFGIRAFAAVIKSVIYDSTMRYFAQPVIIPPEAQLVMITGTLVFGAAGVMMFVVLFHLHLAAHPRLGALPRRRLLLAETVLFSAAAFLFVLPQADPLMTVPQYVLVLAILHIVFSLQLTGRFADFNFVVVTGIFASCMTIGLMNHFNSELERDSLQTIASEINRPQNEFLLYLTGELLNKAGESAELKELFYKASPNMNAAAFALWRESSLRFEPVQSTVRVFDKSRRELGRFSAGENPDAKPNAPFLHASIDGLEMRVIPDSARFHTAGITPVLDNGILLGFVYCEILFEPGFLINDGVPAFLRDAPLLVNNMIRPEDLNFFLLKDNEPDIVYGDFMPRTEQLAEIVQLRHKKDADSWHRFAFNHEDYIAYAQKTGEAQNILVVVLKEKEFEWNFFNFFKIFILHSIVIFFTVLSHGFFSFIRRRAMPLTFRAQLLIAFLTISILPVVALALYNRYSTNEKIRSTAQSTLENNLRMVVRQLSSDAAGHSDLRKKAETVFSGSGVRFTVYDRGHILLSNAPYLYAASIFPPRISDDVLYNMEQGGLKQYFTSTTLGEKEYYALYAKVKIGRQTVILEANSLLNFIPGMYSPFDVDVFLFGIYSFAIMLIIAMSSILANRIALPIRRLTQATQSVAHGDLNIKLDGQVHGELKDLFEGFNTMTEELHRNQSELASLEREVAWKEFAKQVAHEIKNPLTPMKLTMQQLMAAYRDKSPHFDSIFTKVSGTILNQIETLNTIASEFSHFARMPALKLERLDMLPLLHESIALFQNEHIAMSVHAEGMSAVVVDGDVSQSRRMFVNFIRNALQAHATEMEFSLSESHTTYTLRITDNGSGIPAGLEDKIFESNFTTKSSGMGLGLKLAKRYLESIGGSIALDRAPEKGVRFIITLKKP